MTQLACRSPYPLMSADVDNYPTGCWTILALVASGLAGYKKVLPSKTFFHTWGTRSTLLPHLNNIQSPIRQQFTHLNHLQNPHCNTPSRSLKVKRQIIDHGIGRSQVFTETGKQTFRINIKRDAEDAVGVVRRFFLRRRLQIKIQSPFSSFIELLVTSRLSARHMLICSWRVRCNFSHGKTPRVCWSYHHSLRNEVGVAAVRGFADRDSRDRQTRRSPTHSHL
ncbi:hypothetical protein EMIT043CA1_100141 [Pseudomonas brassicacearum]